ncbi:MAG: hypothetical protein ACRDHZ_16960 [Ktedonobacteraceae bacterium]
MSLESAFAISMLVVVAIGLSTFLHRQRKRRQPNLWPTARQDEVDRHTEKLWRAKIALRSAATDTAMARWHSDARSEGRLPDRSRPAASVTRLRARRRSPTL